jgi:predicted permease
MAFWRRLACKLYNFVRPARPEQELDREIASHLTLLQDRFSQEGMSSDEAFWAAKRVYGGIEQAKELHRDERSLVWLEQVRQDLRYALRQFRRSPGFTLVVTLSLACGIGANTAIFTAIDALLLQSLPVRDAQDLVQLDSANQGNVNTLRGFSYPGFEILRKASTPVLSGVFAYTSADTSSSIYPALATSNVVYRGNAAIGKGMLGSAEMYTVLGVQPAIGRLFVAGDARTEGGSPVAVLGYSYWQTRFGGDRSIIGKTIVVNRVPLTVIGITPREFRGVELGYSPDFTVPVSMAAALKLESIENGSAWWLSVLGRKKPGVGNRRIEVTLQPAFRLAVNDLVQSTPATMTRDIQRMVSGLVLKVRPANQGAFAVTREDLRRSLSYLMAMFVLLLGIACVNIANLILARTASRQTEIRVRLSLGASSARVFRQLLTETLAIALIGGVLALPFAWYGGPALLSAFADESVAASLNLNPDWRVFMFTFSAAALCGICLGFVPVFQIAKARLRQAVNEGRMHRSKTPDALIVTQIALALLLAVGAGLLVRSFQNIRRIHPGFRPDSVLVFTVTHSSLGYSGSREQQFYHHATERLERLPGVLSVSFARSAPGSSDMGTFVRVSGKRPQLNGEPVSANIVGSKYFETVGIDLLLGRSFNIYDAPNAPSVVIVNEAFVHRYFGNGNPIGRTFTMLGNPKKPIEIVGVVGDVKEHGLLAAAPLMMYLPYRQSPGGDITFFLRTSGDPLRYIPAVHRVFKRLDPLVPLSGIGTLSLQLGGSVSRERVLAELSSITGLLALILASIGLYGVIAYSVSRETKSFGIRMALGAQAGAILLGVFRRVFLLVSSGVGIGLLCVFGLSRYLKSFLYGLTPNDPASIAFAGAILMIVSLAAAYFPARRAAHVDPAIALRDE